MLFGQSVFESVIERLRQEKQEESAAPTPPAGHRIAGLSSGFVVDTYPDAPQPANASLDAYLAFLPDPVALPEAPPEPEPEPEPMPAHLEKTSLSDVSAELAIQETDTAATLAEKRRAFARRNHPDGVRLEFRHNATLRMTAANLLIDQAIRMLRTREHFQ